MFFWGVGGNSVRIHSWLIWGYPMIPGNSKCRLILQQTLVEQLFCHKCNRRATGVSDCTVTKQTRIVFNKEVGATITAATIWYLTPRRGSWEKISRNTSLITKQWLATTSINAKNMTSHIEHF